MARTDNSIMLIQIPSSLNRSEDLALSTSPSQEIRGLKLFRAISKRLTKKSQEDLNNEDSDSRCSSSDSCSSTSAGRSSRSSKKMDVDGYISSEENGDRLHSSRHKHSASVENFRRMFEGLSVNSNRSQSCTRTKQKRKSSKKSSPKKILRSPVTYTYVKGLSGLPTQRIPRSEVRVYANGSCRCSMQCIKSLNR